MCRLFVAAAYFYADFVHRRIDFLRFDAFARHPVVFHVPRSKRDVFLVTELLNLSVHRKAVHRRQVAAGLFTAFLHVKQDFTCRSYNPLFFGGIKLVDRGLPITM